MKVITALNPAVSKNRLIVNYSHIETFINDLGLGLLLKEGFTIGLITVDTMKMPFRCTYEHVRPYRRVY
jgi:hypothetical protein